QVSSAFSRISRRTTSARGSRANKQRYEADVQEPFLRLIADLAPTLKKIGGGFTADPSPNGGSMRRLYRGIRFSKDKSPRKDFAISTPLTDQEITGDDFLDLVLQRLRATVPFVQFLSNAVGLP